MADKVGKVMHEYRLGDLHSGSPSGPVVTKRSQAVAIALNEQRQQKAKNRPAPPQKRKG